MKIVVSGGGTGGHIYPALALIREIQKESNINAEFLYIGTKTDWKVHLYREKGSLLRLYILQVLKESFL